MSVIWSGITSEGAIVPIQVSEDGKVIATADVADNYVEKSGDTMTGPLILSENPTQTLQAATKAYVDLGLADQISPLAFGKVNANGNLIQGFNILRATSGSEGVYLVTFTNPLPNPDYSLVISQQAASRYVSVSNFAVDGFVVTMYDRNTGELKKNSFSFQIFGTTQQYSLSKSD